MDVDPVPKPTASNVVSQNSPSIALEKSLSLPTQPEFSHVRISDQFINQLQNFSFFLHYNLQEIGVVDEIKPDVAFAVVVSHQSVMLLLHPSSLPVMFNLFVTHGTQYLYPMMLALNVVEHLQKFMLVLVITFVTLALHGHSLTRYFL